MHIVKRKERIGIFERYSENKLISLSNFKSNSEGYVTN